MKFKKKLSICTLTAFVLIIVSACGSANNSGSNSSSDSKDTITYGIESDPGNNMNVITTGDRYGLMALKLLYSPLYMYNGADNIQYFLAKSATQSANKLSVDVKLRDDVKWNDGEIFNADDVIFTYNAILDEKNAGWAVDQLMFDGKPIKVEKVSDYDVKFTFPVASDYELESIANIFIMPQHIYKDVTNFENTALNNNPIGTGPYKLASYKAGDSLTFTKNDSYFLGTPKVSTVIFKQIGDAQSAQLAVKKGQMDILAVDAKDVSSFKSSTNVSIQSYSENRIGYLAFNMQSPNVTDKDVRTAILNSLDKKALVDAAYVSEDYSYIANSFLPRAATFYDSKVTDIGFDLDNAKKLVSSKGISGKTYKLAYSSTTTYQQTQATVIQQEAKAAGINIQLMPLDPTALGQDMQKGTTDFDMYLGGYIMGYDPDTFSTLFMTGSNANYMRYSNKDVDNLFAKGKLETDSSKRQEIYSQVQQKINDDVVFYSISENKRIIAINSSIDGIQDAGLVPVYTFEDMSKLYFK